jgi:hypothetical protein
MHVRNEGVKEVRLQLSALHFYFHQKIKHFDFLITCRDTTFHEHVHGAPLLALYGYMRATSMCRQRTRALRRHARARVVCNRRVLPVAARTLRTRSARTPVESMLGALIAPPLHRQRCAEAARADRSATS